MQFLKSLSLQVGILVPLLTSLTVASDVAAADSRHIQWERNVDQALEISRSTGRPILIQMTASWCGWCHRMLATTLADIQVVQTVNSQFVPLLLDADEHEQLVEKIQVGAFPSTIIVSLEMTVIGRIEGYQRPAEFMRNLQPYQKTTPHRAPAELVNASSRSPERPAAASATLSLPSPVKTADTPTDAIRPDNPGTSSSGEVRLTASGAAAPEPGFQGLCLVSLLEDRRITTGNSAITTLHRGQLLLFATIENRDSFVEHPDRYWPLFDGHCPVAMAAGDANTIGTPATVAVFRDHLVMFRSLASREKFAADPSSCLNQLRNQAR